MYSCTVTTGAWKNQISFSSISTRRLNKELLVDKDSSELQSFCCLKHLMDYHSLTKNYFTECVFSNKTELHIKGYELQPTELFIA
jgi:predicted ATP-binding protein involved in virulence